MPDGAIDGQATCNVMEIIEVGEYGISKFLYSKESIAG
jgi:hypothetical protein